MKNKNRAGTKCKDELKAAYEKLKNAYLEVKNSYEEMIFRMALVAEYKDETTGTHLVRIADYSTEIARSLKLAKKDVETLRYASPMHDIGKLILPDKILKKTTGLTAKERKVVEEHTAIGAKIFKGSKSPLLKTAAEICLTHHEKYDGTGYPMKLKGKEIPLFGRIVAVADVFDALTSTRPYKKAYDFDEAVEMIRKQSGKHFDPKVVDAFLKRGDEINAIWRATKDIEHFVDEKHLK